MDTCYCHVVTTQKMEKKVWQKNIYKSPFYIRTLRCSLVTSRRVKGQRVIRLLATTYRSSQDTCVSFRLFTWSLVVVALKARCTEGIFSWFSDGCRFCRGYFVLLCFDGDRSTVLCLEALDESIENCPLCFNKTTDYWYRMSYCKFYVVLLGRGPCRCYDNWCPKKWNRHACSFFHPRL